MVKGHCLEEPHTEAFWSLTAETLLGELQTTAKGLTNDEARRRLDLYGPNLLEARNRAGTFTLLLSQFKSPLVLILLFAAVLAYFFGDISNPIIILVIVIISGLLGFWQEKGANNAAERLIALVQVKASVQRNGVTQEVPVESVVPGDITILKAGDMIPGDCLILESKDLFVDEAILTGETYPVEKVAGRTCGSRPYWRRGRTAFLWAHM